MPVTDIELRANLSKYLLLAMTEDIFITQHGNVVAKLTNPFQDKLETAKSLFGILPQTMTLENAKEERVNEI
ncbi:MAG: type II toxin-antitoxin system prevent-host-death family antitoxin [Synergistaceae bacterium]|nr:type II toxin-antitoxin system prevent-host-death family antitoxin [Synergistaceae bacterium]MBR0186284.1 type II toxin-antitoxin system prevent-host-death family antitoxin [Synergistaceae bacterium]